MQNIICLKTLHKIIAYVKEKSFAGYAFIFSYYQKLNLRQRVMMVASIGGMVLLLLVISILFHLPRQSRSAYSVNFETPRQSIKAPNIKTATMALENTQNKKLEKALHQLKIDSYQQLNSLQAQLQAMQSQLGSLASESDIAQLQQTALAPNAKLLHQMSTMQQTLQTVIQQTAKKVWVDPKAVEKYFQLIAVQGFSDGMRAIIDVDGNQTTLSLNEICPACRGWVLKNMDFPHQSAVFEKTQNGKQTFVKLQAN